MTDLGIERRSSTRTSVKLRCYVVTQPKWHMHILAGTENMSRNGAMIRAPKNGHVSPAVGQYVEADVELPYLENEPPRSLHCKGAVVWKKESHDKEELLGISIHSMEFRELPRRFRGEDAASLQAPSKVLM